MKLSESVISVPNENDWWALLFLLLAGTKTDPEEILKREEERRKRADYEKEVQYHCNHIEWEQDMHATIPFCKLDGDFCNMQCMRR